MLNEVKWNEKKSDENGRAHTAAESQGVKRGMKGKRESQIGKGMGDRPSRYVG